MRSCILLVTRCSRNWALRKQTEEREKRERRVRSEPRQMWRVPTIFPTVTDREFQDVGKLLKTHYAKVAELADAPDLGSGGETREGSSPSFRTKKPVPVLSSQLCCSQPIQGACAY